MFHRFNAHHAIKCTTKKSQLFQRMSEVRESCGEVIQELGYPLLMDVDYN